VVPLVLAKGAGAEMRHMLGVAVFSGMLGVTVFGVFFTPVFYSVVRKFAESKEATSAHVVPAPVTTTSKFVEPESDGNGYPAASEKPPTTVTPNSPPL
jgi:hypothetical protein